MSQMREGLRDGQQHRVIPNRGVSFCFQHIVCKITSSSIVHGCVLWSPVGMVKTMLKFAPDDATMQWDITYIGE